MARFLVITACSYSINLIKEYDAFIVLVCLLKHGRYYFCAVADKVCHNVFDLNNSDFTSQLTRKTFYDVRLAWARP